MNHLIFELESEIKQAIVDSFIESFLDGDRSYDAFFYNNRQLLLLNRVNHVTMNLFISSTEFSNGVASKLKECNSTPSEELLTIAFCEAISLN